MCFSADARPPRPPMDASEASGHDIVLAVAAMRIATTTTPCFSVY